MMNRTFSTMMTSAVVLGSLMVGCSGGAQDHPKLASTDAPAGGAKIERLLADKDYDQAQAGAETLVAAEPRNGDARALLARAYLANGRYLSARTTFNDALTLGNRDPRSIISLAMSETALGDLRAARNLLADHIADLPAADYGLAMAMAGDPREGVRALLEAAQAPDATAKTRQNLAYALAMGGAWGQARLIAGRDLSTREAEVRIGQWAQFLAKGDESERVVAMLGVSPRTDDAGLPAQLALNAALDAPVQLASAADVIEDAKPAAPAPEAAPAPQYAAPAPAPKSTGDAKPAAVPAPTAVAVAAPVAPQPLFHVTPVAAPATDAKPAFAPDALAAILAKPPVGPISLTSAEPLEQAEPRRAVPDAPAFAPAPAVAQAPATTASAVKVAFSTAKAPAAPVAKAMPAPLQATLDTAFAAQKPAQGPTRKFVSRLGAPVADGKASDWVVQLGAFDSDALARNQWTKLSQSREALKYYKAVHSVFAVNGRTFYRLAVRGFEDRGAAVTACSVLKTSGQDCFVRRDDKSKA